MIAFHGKSCTSFATAIVRNKIELKHGGYM